MSAPVPPAQPQPHQQGAVLAPLPRITIQFCTQCKWMLRAAYVRLNFIPPPLLLFLPLSTHRFDTCKCTCTPCLITHEWTYC